MTQYSLITLDPFLDSAVSMNRQTDRPAPLHLSWVYGKLIPEAGLYQDVPGISASLAWGHLGVLEVTCDMVSGSR